MADEKVPEQQGQKSGGSSVIKIVILGSVSVILPAICAVLVYLFVLRPMLAQQNGSGNSQTATAEVDEGIPPTAVVVKFDEAQATVVTPKNESPAPLFIYQVAMSCSDAKVASVIEGKKEYFTAMINKIHRNKTRAELNDPAVQEALLRQTKEEANLLLKKLSPGMSGKVLEVMYLKYTIVDL